jgi:hypothetical protein
MAYQVISPIINYFFANNMAKEYTAIEGERCELVQINIPLGLQYLEPLYFDSNSVLDGENSTITAIEFLIGTELLYSPDGLLNDIDSIANYGVLTISDLKRQTIAQFPLKTLSTYWNNGKLRFTFFNEQVWQNCNIQFNLQNYFNFTPQLPLMFNVYYVPKIKN